MGEGIERSGRQSGGIVSLAKQVMKHREAIGYDLLTKTGHEFNDIGESLSWDALGVFLNKIDVDSALFRELNPELATWTNTAKTNAILADIYDILAAINANIMSIGSGKPARKPKPYPRPVKHEHDDEKRIGSGGLPPDELRKWFERKRAELNGRNSTGDNNSHSSP